MAHPKDDEAEVITPSGEETEKPTVPQAEEAPEPTTPEVKITEAAPVPRTDEERAKSHFHYSDEQWKTLTSEQKETLLRALPTRGSSPEIPKEEVKEIPLATPEEKPAE